MSQPVRIIIIGRSGSGKDYLRKFFQKAQVQFQPSYTTRLPRSGEKDGEDYFFISLKEFEEKLEQKFFFEHDDFGAKYGTSVKQFYAPGLSLFIMSPNGIKKISEEDQKQSILIYLTPDNLATLEERIRKRPGFSEEKVQARIQADKAQFTQIVPRGNWFSFLQVFSTSFDAQYIVDSTLKCASASVL